MASAIYEMCKRPGHATKECPTRSGEMRGKCYNCRQVGHQAWECSNRQPRGVSSSAENVATPRPSQQPQRRELRQGQSFQL